MLSSQSVVFHAQDKFCHEVQIPSIGKRPARLLAADWGAGMALLEVPGLALTGLPSTDALTSVSQRPRMRSRPTAFSGTKRSLGWRQGKNNSSHEPSP